MLINQKQLLSLYMCLSILGCTTAEQAVKPLDSQATTTKILDKNPTSTSFNRYLVSQGYQEKSLPIKVWGFDELILSALFYHTKLDIAKNKLRLAELAVHTAGIKSNPNITAGLGRSNQKNGDIIAWSYGLSVDIPIGTSNKRSIKIEKAEQEAEAARMDVAEISWTLRNQIAIDLIAYHQTTSELTLLDEELITQAGIAGMLKKRVNAGIASKTELSNIILLGLEIEQLSNKKRAKANTIRAKLAADAGLSHEKFVLLPITSLVLDRSLAKLAQALKSPLTLKKLQVQALLNRIDIRRSIANYAATEAEIKLQVAKQTPDIILSPGILFDFGDSIWSLGFSSLLNTLNKNTVLIDEAKQLRAIEGAQFEDLQATIITRINQTLVRYRSAHQILKHAEHQHTKRLVHIKNMQKQFDAGIIGKVALNKLILNSIKAKQHLLEAKFNLLQVGNQIENVMLKPMSNFLNMSNLNDKQTTS